MKATEAKLLEFLKKSPQFVIPIYQRTYSWGERECRQLWDDILRTGRNDAVSAHFVGSIDPKGICLDVPGMGRWGNGDVDVGLAFLEELPYVMGLVRQWLEKQ